MNTRKYLTTAVLAALVSPTLAAQITLDPVTVTATKTETTDFAATYSSEVYSADDIAASGTASLYAFLNQNTSITVMPSFGNPYSQLIDMRGYGIGDGYQNIVISIDGRRMNNIDMSPQLLSSIPLKNIDRIEITKGSGSVVYGDGSTAGSIQIYTKDVPTTSLSAGFGTDGQKTAAISTGLSEQYFQLSVFADHSELDGFSDTDIAGFKDASSNNNSRVMLDITPTDALRLFIGKEHSNIDTRYPGNMTLAEFNSDPAQNSESTYLHQAFKTDTVSFGFAADISDRFTLSYNHSNEDKISDFISYSSIYTYDYKSDEILASYSNTKLRLTSGVQQFDGQRDQSGAVTTKKNTGYFVQSEFYLSDMTFSLGGRKESVDYQYAPTAGTSLNDSHHLSSYDIGFNKQFSEQLSVFSNYNSAYQAPDIDRFFNYGGTFNEFINPARTKTFNLGLNHITDSDKSKLTLFRSNLNNEIYYFSTGSFFTSFNTNIDKSHKYGLELQNRHQFSEKLASIVNYAYTRAIIDSENEGAGAFNGKDLPGVSRHNITVGLHYSPTVRSKFVATHNYRSSAYALNDFENNFTQKQKAYQSTNLAYSYSRENLTVSLSVDNLFEKSNGIWISDDKIYPVNFTRNWRISTELSF